MSKQIRNHSVFSIWFVSALLLLQPVSAHALTSSNLAADSSLVKLRGEVTGLHLLEEDRSMIRWELKLKLKLVNEGNKPANFVATGLANR